MSILKSIVNSVRASFSNEAFDQMKVREMHDKIMEAIREASADGTITAEEIAEVKELTEKLEITDNEMNHIKRDVLKDLIEHIIEDGKVSEDEMKLYQEVEDGLEFADEDKDKLAADIAKVKKMYEAN